MSRANDVGGQTGFGPVPVDGDGVPGGGHADGDGAEFMADWEARVWAVHKILRRRGLFGSDEFRDAIERLPAGRYVAASYFERWLEAMEMLLDERAADGAVAER